MQEHALTFRAERRDNIGGLGQHQIQVVVATLLVDQPHLHAFAPRRDLSSPDAAQRHDRVDLGWQTVERGERPDPHAFVVRMRE